MEITTRYADAGGVKIAYQVTGSGPDLVVVPGFVSHVELEWSDPPRRRFLNQLGRIARVIRYDKRGTGLSDPVAAVPDLEERIADLEAVMAAAACDRPFLFGISEGGPIAMQYSVRNPRRLSGLLLYSTYAAKPPDALGPFIDAVLDRWGEGYSMYLFAPDAGNEEYRKVRGAMERAGASPMMARALVDAMRSIDVTDILGDVDLPTVIMHRREETAIPLQQAELIHAGIRGSRLVVLEGRDHMPWLGDTDSIINAIGAFMAVHKSTPAQSAPARTRRQERPLVGAKALTPAEAQVTALLREGLSNQQIADRLLISRLTVETHLKRVYGKLGVSSRAELLSHGPVHT